MDFFSAYNISFWLCVPSVLVACWAISQKMKINNWLGVLTLSMVTAAMLINLIVIDYLFLGWTPPIGVYFASHYINCLFFPWMYFYSSKKMRFDFNTWHFWMMLLLTACIILPNISFVYDTLDSQYNTHFHSGLVVRCKHIAFILGDKIYQIPMELVIIIFQLILCTIGTRHVLHPKYGAPPEIPETLKSIYKGWSTLFVTILVLPFLPFSLISSSIGRWICFLGFSAVTGTLFLFYGMGYDEHIELVPDLPEEPEEDDVPETVETLGDAARALFKTNGYLFKQGLVIDDVVTELGTNRTYFTRMMRDEFGMSFNEYLIKKRCEHACELLLDTNMSLEEIAHRCGLSDATSLNRVFKRVEGDTPDHWRKVKRINMFNGSR